jgi:hypothetical protein
MPIFIPKFQLYKADGTSPQYTIANVMATNWPQEGEQKYTEHTNLRSTGSIIIPGGKSSWDLIIHACLLADDYTTLTTKKTTLQSSIALATRYVLTIDKSSTTFDTLKVMRLSEIDWERTNTRTYQMYNLIFRVGSWS